MPLLWLVLTVLALAAAGFFVARQRALASAGGEARKLHSLPSYYGFNAVILTIAPAMALIAIWAMAEPTLIEWRVSGAIPESVAADPGARSLIMADVRRIAEGLNTAVEQGALTAEQARDIGGNIAEVRAQLAELGILLGSDVQPEVLEAAQSYRALGTTGNTALTVLALLLAIGGFAIAVMKSDSDFRARNSVERGVLTILVAAASIAILTTVGIVLSMVFETWSFFGMYSWTEFFFGLEWAPQFHGGSELGLLPLLWGTLYISFIALLFSVPVGLFAAIYLAEYAGRKTRAIAKPMIEILAGIPTIVYGLFALITVGPLLRDYFAEPLGFGTSASSVMTAGLVMGIMLIPFVSSLSDDIIGAVPQSLRDGSLGVGATKSETIKKVVLPAALPGIVGAVLLAASRAIGETMIVVLGAGASAQLDLNPFEAMTTVTVKIVGQLTGDTDFSSAETLVAFALGFTLFVITLGLNVLALYIVRRYREQYE
ncbi:phosphate ABC transporter permease subunit PstC [Tranquillimonas alkanivorans]|uniref:Phosphate transport system permease protein n=1 Tax=Tranquillimonas alkanivorans TaxID=441119 RepID=A0A1I5P3D8_9RHOB|nr:phosphate ABC transporter permease subunit PstC [Tranquillimonas alkanivorans]SFP28604.1 phosphate ABC transporter membrane protein 1, PhoT family [Tranquillimonas alkanivorans]